MKYLLSLLIIWLVSFSLITGFNYVEDSSAGFVIFSNKNSEIPYCQSWDKDCWLEGWIDAIKDVDNTKSDEKASEFIQRIVVYVLWFLQLIAVLIIIYSWFVLLTWVWDEEKAKKTKQIITYTVLWLIIIWLAYPISKFIFDILNGWTQ